MTKEIILAFVGAFASAVFGFLISPRFINKNLLPSKFGKNSTTNNHLAEIKYEYRLNSNPQKPGAPAWIRSDIKLEVKKNKFIKGQHTRLTGDNNEPVEYEIIGEIREGHMIITETCKHNPTKFFTAIYSNTLSKINIPGILIDFEDNSSLAALTILTSKHIEKYELNNFIKKNGFKQFVDIDISDVEGPIFESITQR